MFSTAIDEADDAQYTFEVIDGTPYIEDSYRLRYQVYCGECGFLPPEDYPDGRETDAYDGRSVHIGAMVDGRLRGTVRLVLDSPQGLPLQDHCVVAFDNRWLFERNRRPRGHGVAEISRLCVSRSFGSEGGERGRTQRAKLVAGLYGALYRASKTMGITHLVMAMERTLRRRLCLMGFTFEAAGPEVDYYGPVRPYMASVTSIERELRVKRPALYAQLTRGLEHLAEHPPEITCPALPDPWAIAGRRRNDETGPFLIG